MDRNKILLAFKDDEDARKATGHLSDSGFKVSTARDGAVVLELAIEEPPSAIVIDLDLPVIDGERIFRILGNNPTTARIPFLFLSDGIADIKRFRSGIDMFLLRPLNMDELYGKIRQALSIESSVEVGAKEFQGRLTHMSVPDIIQFLHLNKKEGELRMTCGNMRGTVLLKGGEIYDCTLGNAEKEKALFRMLPWNEGSFEFIHETVSSWKKIRSTTSNLLMEGMRQIDEFRKKSSQLPDVKMAVRSKIQLKDLPKGLNPVIYEITGLAEIYSRVGDIIEHCTCPDYEAYKSLANLISKGIIEKIKDSEDSHGELLTRDQEISVREKIISRYSDWSSSNYAKIFLISTCRTLAANFIRQCGRIPGCSVNLRPAPEEDKAANPFGEAATIMLHGGMELVLFTVSTVRNMAPLVAAFSTNLTGMILLWDENAEKDIKELAKIKREMILRKRVPVVHVCSSRAAADNPYFRKDLNLKAGEPLLLNEGVIFDVFHTLFENLVKNDYISL